MDKTENTLRTLADELLLELRLVRTQVEDLQTNMLGPVPTSESPEAKEPPNDLRSALERALNVTRVIKGDLMSIHGGLGIPDRIPDRNSVSSRALGR
jgi:hypothetical protein